MDIETRKFDQQFEPFTNGRLVYQSGDSVVHAFQLKKYIFDGEFNGEVRQVELPSRQALISVRFGEDHNKDGWDWPDINLKAVVSEPWFMQLTQCLSELKLRVSVNGMTFDSDCQVDVEAAKARFKYFYPADVGKPEWRSFFREGDNVGVPIIRDYKTPISMKIGKSVVDGFYHHEIELPADIKMVIGNPESVHSVDINTCINTYKHLGGVSG